jgi:hypothetical protein
VDELTTPKAVRTPGAHRWALLACPVCWAPLEMPEDVDAGVCSESCAELAAQARAAFDAWLADDLAPGSPAAATWKTTMTETIERRRARAGTDERSEP